MMTADRLATLIIAFCRVDYIFASGAGRLSPPRRRHLFRGGVGASRAAYVDFRLRCPPLGPTGTREYYFDISMMREIRV